MRNPSPAVRHSLRAAGFSLIELMIVVAVIVIIAALAIPNMLHARLAANESAAVAALRTIASEEVNYDSSWSSGYSTTLAQLGPPLPGNNPSSANADMIDSILASGIRGGYQFIYVPLISPGLGTPTGYTVNANPISPGITGEWYFYLDQSNVIRQSYGSPANATSAVIPR